MNFLKNLHKTNDPDTIFPVAMQSDQNHSSHIEKVVQPVCAMQKEDMNICLPDKIDGQ